MKAARLAPLVLAAALVACGASAHSADPTADPSTIGAANVRTVNTNTPTVSTTPDQPPTLITPIATAARSTGTPATEEATSTAAVTLSQPPDDPHSWHFEPATVTVKAGGTVTWTNLQGNEIHTVTADDGKSFDSNVISSGDSFQQTFATAGTFAYHCTLHNWMKGVVVVVP